MSPTNRDLLICVVDDDDDVRAMMCRKLEDAGYRTVQAANGVEAITALRKARVDLAIVDIFMPEQEGLSTITQMKREWPGMPVLAVSGGGSTGAGQYLGYAREMGADEILHKPFREAAFLEQVRRLAAHCPQ